MQQSTDRVGVIKHPTKRLAKVWGADGRIAPYDNGQQFIGEEHSVADIHELSKLLTKLERDPHAAVIRGKYKGYEYSLQAEPDDTKKNRVLRRKSVHDDEPHHWLMVDVDNFEPVHHEPLLDPVGAIDEFIETQLPTCFHGASYHWQLSSSAGHPSKNPAVLKAHIWFWMTTPYTSAQLRAWAEATGYKGDKALLDTIQVHYTAAPIFEDGVRNPVKVRSGFVSGEFGDAVDLVIPDDIRADSSDKKPAKRRDPIFDAIVEAGLYEREMGRGKHSITCPWEAEHSDYGRAGGDGDTYYRAAHHEGFDTPLIACSHACHADRGTSDFLAAIGLDDLAGVFSSLELPAGANIGELFSDVALREEIVQQMADAEFLVPDMIVRGHVAVYIAHANGGKTAVFVYLSEQLAAMGMQVLYINVDGSPGDLKRHFAHAKQHGYTVIAPDACDGKSVDDVVAKLKAIAGSNQRCDEYVFIFDTLKKFVDVIQKKDAKDFYKLTRSLSVKGATICFLGHANKHNGVDGQMVYEGTVDLRNDVDEMIYLVSRLNEQTNELEVTTRPDKVRAEFSPVSYIINRDTREVREASRVIRILADEDRELVDLISGAIAVGKHSQKDIIEWVKERSLAGDKKIRNTLVNHCQGENPIFGFERTGRGKDLHYFVHDPFECEDGL